MNVMKIIILLVSLVLVGGFVFYGAKTFSEKSAKPTFTDVELRGGKIVVELATTKTKREQGLSGRKEVAQGSGMLFVFDEPGKHSVWMKDMGFGLDIVWLNEEKRIVDFKTDVVPCASDLCESLTPSDPAKYVLELPTGTLSSLGGLIGDQVKIAN